MFGPSHGLVLWAGPKHSGKTTALTELASRGRQGSVSVGGFLAPSLYEDRQLLGFDIVDVATGRRRVLARRGASGGERIGCFSLAEEGLAFGRAVLEQLPRSVRLCLVDEYGPLELAGGGWRGAVDGLIRRTSAWVVLAVRQELVERVAEVYRGLSPRVVPFDEPGAIDRVLDLARGEA